MQSTEKSNRNGGRKASNKQSKGETADAASSASRDVHTFIAGLSPADRAQHRGGFLFVLQCLVGKEILIRTKDGGEVKGIFNTATPFDTARGTEVVVKMAKVKGGKKAIDDGSTVVINIDEVLAIEAADVDLEGTQKDSVASGELQTDGDLSTTQSRKLGGAELKNLDGRNLAGVDASWLSADAGTLESGGSKGGSWDQFEVNKRLYNVNSTYDENLYTKALNRNDLTREQIRNAEKYAKEIEGTRSSNMHLQEERGQAIERDMDEEDLYSGVLRPTAASASVPKSKVSPAATGANGSWRRAVTGDAAAAPVSPPPPAKASKTTAGNKTNNKPQQGGGKANQKTQAAEPLGAPPGYGDEYIPVATNGTGLSSAPERPKTPEHISSPSKAVKEAARSESPPPQINFYGVPEKTAEAVTSEKKNETAAAADEKPAANATPVVAPVQPAVAEVASKSTLNVNAKEFKFNANAKEFVFSPKAATPAPVAATAPVQPPPTGSIPYGKQQTRRNDAYQGGFNNNNMNMGYDHVSGYGMPPMQQQWGGGGPMMYNSGMPIMMNGPIVPPVGDMYQQYPDAPYGMGMGMGMGGPHMVYPAGGYMPMGGPVGGRGYAGDVGYMPGGQQPHAPYAGRGGGRGRGGYQGRGQGGNAHPQGDNAARVRSGSQVSGDGNAAAPQPSA